MTDLDPTGALAWNPDAAAYLRDLEAKPSVLRALGQSATVRAAIAALPDRPREVLFLGMGSSRYAAEVAAMRLRAAGIAAAAEYASTQLLPPARPELLVVGISATGSSKETIAAMTRYAGGAATLALTESAGSPLGAMTDAVIPLEAGLERGGVACRTFQHTGLLLRLMESRWTRDGLDFVWLCERVADATADLLERRGDWLEPTLEALDSDDGVHVLAPSERWSSAAQSALMFREGPRRAATASETGDWSHVDVYLTKTTDYRALLLAGSPYDDDAVQWLTSRGSAFVSVGPGLSGAQHQIDLHRLGGT